MSDKGAGKSGSRGEAAWREARDRVAERNEEARKAGRKKRAEKDRERMVERRAAENRDMAEAISKHDER